MVHVTKTVMLELEGEGGDCRYATAELTQGPSVSEAYMLAALCSSGFQSFICAAGSESGLCALAVPRSQPDSLDPVASLVCVYIHRGETLFFTG